MNKTYKTIWNLALGAWVAAPETAHSGGQSSRAACIEGTQATIEGLTFRIQTLFSPVAFAMALGLSVVGSAWADGGMGSAGRPSYGGAGGQDQLVVNGENGKLSKYNIGGGGGGGAGVQGGNGGSSTGSASSIGGIGGISAGMAGTAGGSAPLSGGGGGGGGAHGFLGTSLTQAATGGAGGRGGDGAQGIYDGGGGGSGGYGAVLQLGSVAETIQHSVLGGSGGDGGTGDWAGNAGSGGKGLHISGSVGAQILIKGGTDIQGGAGGAGGSAWTTTSDQLGGSGAAGGAGITAIQSTIELSVGSQVNGGSGGVGGTGKTVGAHGVGGEGINGSNLFIINSGTIAGGLAGDALVRANAITFGGSDNTLELRAGSAIVGNVVAVAGGSDELTLGGTDNSQFDLSTIGVQYQNFARFSKTGSSTWTVTGTQTAAGDWSIKAGTLRAGAANVFNSSSAYTVSSGAALDLAGYNQTLPSVNNSGTIRLSGAAPGTVLTVTGPYVGNNGTLALSTALGADGSVTDKILLSSPLAVASGHTSLQITNAGGLGAQTTGSGIEVVGTENGASLQPGSFTLAGGHVDAGAYEYRLIQTAQSAALHSSLPAPAPAPAPAPTYRAEVPLLSALPAQLRQADMAMLGDLHKRMGDEASQVTTNTGVEQSRRVWGRVLRTDPTIRQQGTVSPESSGHMTGFQAGLDLYADKNVKAGIYIGQLDGDMSVKGFASGVQRKYVGFNNLRTRYLGVYGTWQDASGLYADAVVQGADYRSDSRTADDKSNSRTKGDGWLASLELGKPFTINSSWQVEPQAQIIYRKLSIDDTALSLASVKNKTDDDWTLRLGARIKGNFSTGAGLLQPYGRINIYKASSTTDMATFITPGASTDIKAKGGYTATELAAGATLQLSNSTSLYGELSKLWANGGDSRVKSGVQASVGVKVLW